MTQHDEDCRTDQNRLYKIHDDSDNLLHVSPNLDLTPASDADESSASSAYPEH